MLGGCVVYHLLGVFRLPLVLYDLCCLSDAAVWLVNVLVLVEVLHSVLAHLPDVVKLELGQLLHMLPCHVAGGLLSGVRRLVPEEAQVESQLLLVGLISNQYLLHY